MTEVPERRDLDQEAVASYRGALRAFVRRRVGTGAEADDLVQEAFLRLYAANATMPISEPQAYLFRIAANLIIDHRRRSSTALARADCYDQDMAPAVAADQECGIRQQQLQRLFEDALTELTDRQRRVFIMKRFEDKSTLAIAVQLHITPRMVQKHLISAVSHLYARLRSYMDDDL